jgi:peroxiredoxin
MKKGIWCLLIAIIIGSSCNQHPPKKVETGSKNDKNTLIGTPVMETTAIVKNFGIFWNYYSKYAQLCMDYPTLDENGNLIERKAFLEKINTGLYLPLVLYGNPQMKFKLARIPKGSPKDIGLILSNYANRELAFNKLEGKAIPKFSFKDLDGKLYTSENTKGKIVLFKCWFITCQACVEEMPALNELIAKYKDRKDILYISLAIDQKAPLQKFLTTTKFNYVTIPNQRKYMEKDLHVQMYPTHFIINKKGILVKAMDDEQVMESYLEKQLSVN